MTVDSRAVFLSYASQDAEAAARICEALRAAGVEVWLDKNELRGGDAWDAQIKKRIHECALFIPVISAHTNARSEGYFRGEWKLATRRLLNVADDAAFLVPVVIDETREADARVPEEFLHAQWTWLPGGETPPAFANRVRELLGGTKAPANHVSPSIPQGKVTSTGREPKSWFAARVKHRRRLIVLGVGALLLILGGGLYLYYAGPRGNVAVETATPIVAAVADEKSIAVLPFADMSAEKDQEYMSDGIAEELLNLLAQVPDLKVIARTSSFAFKGQHLEIAEIAKKLNVAHVLEGSVRTSGNKLRITAQLVRTADSTHLWSDRYDRPMDDIFAVQDEIASAIVQALQIKLAGGELIRQKGGTQNLEAYQLYLRSSNLQDHTTASSLEAAGEYAEQAIKLDPNYGLAWSALADTYAHKADNGFVPPAVGYERARQAALHALQLSPDLVEAHVRLGYIYRTVDWDWAAADTELQRALSIDPTNPFALRVAGMLSSTLGRWSDAERLFRAALVRDPLDRYAIWNLGHTYYLAGRFAESESTYRKLIDLAPDFGWTRPYLGKTLLAQGRREEALAMVQKEANQGSRLLFLSTVLHATGRRAEADDALRHLIAEGADTLAFFVALNYAYRDDHDLALQWLERAYQQKDSGLSEMVGEPVFRAMGEDPRFKAFLRKIKLPEPGSPR